jgi:hypothetical protein
MIRMDMMTSSNQSARDVTTQVESRQGKVVWQPLLAARWNFAPYSDELHHMCLPWWLFDEACRFRIARFAVAQDLQTPLHFLSRWRDSEDFSVHNPGS